MDPRNVDAFLIGPRSGESAGEWRAPLPKKVKNSLEFTVWNRNLNKPR